MCSALTPALALLFLSLSAAVFDNSLGFVGLSLVPVAATAVCSISVEPWMAG
jgi:hypothetical protein